VSELVVDVPGGRVQGVIKRGVAVWRGIPYASAPRFRPPGPPAAWDGVKDGSKFGPVAMQARDPRTAVISGVGEKAAMDEQCLCLNVVAPPPDGTKRPVIVWIHGGAFIMGSGSTPIYDGTSFAASHGQVVVTINYRLGLFGFLYLGDLAPERYGEAGNVAILDQIAALRWVRDHIAAFGGDPARVTVMGESAGAVSIATLLGTPAARGLFQRAILESGAQGLSPPTREDATAIARRAVDELGGPCALDDVPAERVVALQERIVREKGLAAFFPYTDGVTLPEPALDAVRAGRAAGVPLLMGSNRDEWTLFELFLGDAVVAPLKSALRGKLGATLDPMLAAYERARHDRSQARAWIDLIGDAAFRIPMVRLAEAQTPHAPVWMYRFDYSSTGFGGRLGAAHALELPFVWNALDLPVSQILLGDVTEARPLAAAMHDAWARFVDGEAPRAAALPAWPRYEPPRRATMIFDRACTVADDPGGATRAMWIA
jgi:para-nitrobenzyl esterase